jgi:hypothetical protein
MHDKLLKFQLALIYFRDYVYTACVLCYLHPRTNSWRDYSHYTSF